MFVSRSGLALFSVPSLMAPERGWEQGGGAARSWAPSSCFVLWAGAVSALVPHSCGCPLRGLPPLGPASPRLQLASSLLLELPWP